MGDNSKDVSDILHENYNLTLSIDLTEEFSENSDSILIKPFECSICQMTFVGYEKFLGHICVQIKKQLDFHNQDDFEDEYKSLDISEKESDYIPRKKKCRKSNTKTAQAKISKIIEKTSKHSLDISESESDYIPKKKKSKKNNMKKL